MQVYPLHTDVGVNLIWTAPCHASQTQSAAFVHLCGSLRHDKQGNNSNLWVWWADFTAFLWLGVMTVKMGALEGLFDVFVLFRAGSGVTPTCINELMWRLMLAFKSPLVLRPRCPPLYHLSRSRTNTLFTHTQSTPHTRADTHSFTSKVEDMLLCSHAALR